MSMRSSLRTGSLLVGAALVLALAACGGTPTAQWGDGSPSAGPDPSISVTPTGLAVSASPTATAAVPTKSRSAPAGKKSERPPTTAGVPVTVARAGGIAGVSETLKVEANGHWTYQQQRGAKSQSGTLGAGQRSDLQALLASPSLAQERGGMQGGCADAFTYALTTGSTMIFWRECGQNTPKTASAIVKLLVGATAL